MRPTSAPQLRDNTRVKHRRLDSSRGVVICELCGCSVTASEAARMQHEQGSRHRRMAAAQRHGPASGGAAGHRDTNVASDDAPGHTTRAPLSSRVAEPADPLLSRLTSEIAGQLHVSHVVRYLTQGKKHALSWWQEVHEAGLQHRKPPPRAPPAPSGQSPVPAATEAVPLDLLVAQDSALAVPLPTAPPASAAHSRAEGAPRVAMHA